MPTTDEEYLSESRGPVLLPTMWTLAALTTVFVAARIFVRVWMVRRPGIDDGLIIMALVRPCRPHPNIRAPAPVSSGHEM